MRYYLAACDDNGKCFGFLKNNGVSRNPEAEKAELISFENKTDAGIAAMQVNLGYMLLPGGPSYRVTVVEA